MSQLRDDRPGGSGVPRAIRVRRVSRSLEMDWPDGTTSAWSHSVLRRHCRCAVCEACRRAGEPIDAAANIELLAIVSCGAGAVRFTFSDGHARGIYPYVYLRQLPGQSDCAAES
jgi:DUF971 family protein